MNARNQYLKGLSGKVEKVNQNLTFFLVFATLESKKILLLRKKLWQEQLKL